MAVGDVVVATDGHPFWIPELGEWVDAVDLAPGMWLQTSAGTWVQVSTVEVDTRSATVRNLTVQGVHTYHAAAGDAAVLVHNSGGGIPQVDNARLQNIVNALFHGVGNENLVGDGSVMSAANR